MIAFQPLPIAPCPNEECPNHAVGIDQLDDYQSFGTTKSGSRRYRCKACRKTFAVGKSTVRQKRPHKNRLIFSLLMNKSPLRRICEVAASVAGKVRALLDAKSFPESMANAGTVMEHFDTAGMKLISIEFHPMMEETEPHFETADGE